MKEVAIAIVDDGISELFYICNSLIFDIEVKNDFSVTNRKTPVLYFSHGTLCAQLIKKFDKNAIIGSIKIFETNNTSIVHLECALKWCLRVGVRIINLSIGSLDRRDEKSLYKIVNELNHKEAIIIAAIDNKLRYTIPACYKEVISVSSVDNWNYYKDNADICVPNILVEKPNDLPFSFSNSFASAIVSAEVYSIINTKPSISNKEIKAILYNKFKVLKD